MATWTDAARTRDWRASALARVRAVASAADRPGIVLTRPGPVAWAGAGLNPPIDRSAPIDTVWLAIGPHSCTVVTTVVERDRIAAELLPEDADLVAVPWWDGAALVAAAAEALDADPATVGSDGHPGFGHDLEHELTAARLPLSAAEQDELRRLGRDAAAAVESSLRAWRPGQRDCEVAGRIAAAVEAEGADAPVLLVGADERVRRFRHPVAVGAVTERLVMAVLVARRRGLHVALTRYVSAGNPGDGADLETGIGSAQDIHRGTLAAAAAPGATYGDVLTALDAGYTAAGHPGGWSAHYQGGPIGYGQREFEIAPAQRDSRWWNEPVHPGVALAYNPSLPGGAKDEDTYLLGADGPDLITTTGQWPLTEADPLTRPAVARIEDIAGLEDET